MVIVTAGVFVDNAMNYLTMAANGEKVEIILPNKQTLQVKLTENEED